PMRDGSSRLQKQQTPIGFGEIDARDAFAFYFRGKHLIAAALRDPFVVVGRVERVGGEFKAALSLDTAVARRAVTAALGKDAGDLAAETDRLVDCRTFDL